VSEFAHTEAAPAKINLHLHVVGRRPDGYHLLDSLVVFAAIGDQLTVSPAQDLSLSVTGPFAGALAAEADNLVLRAARALWNRSRPSDAGLSGAPISGAPISGVIPGVVEADSPRVMAGPSPAMTRAVVSRLDRSNSSAAGVAAPGMGTSAGAKLVLEKNLPVASGIGGGSADAAAALRLLSRFWGLDPDAAGSLAAGLGADVPVCLAGTPALMSGIGEVLDPAPCLPDVGLVLVNPGVAVATPAVFRNRSGPFSSRARFPAQGWKDVASLVDSLSVTSNDLEAPARLLAPEIGDALDTVAAAPGCLLSRMSGSGATCFGLFPTPEAARGAASRIVRDGWWVWGGGLAAS
jgi:4-diphosphocytidyl-2-C-methyl-D-erythritol kinase